MCLKTDWALIAVCASLSLFAFIMWAERHNQSEIEKINNEISILKEKISVLQIAKGMGR
jgi:hypothetical protein